MKQILSRALSFLKRQNRKITGKSTTQWCRIVMDEALEKHIQSLNYQSMNVLEISGTKWKDFGFAKYQSIDYPEYDVCKDVLENAAFDIIIIEQVLEHVLWPYRAVKHLYEMVKKDGVLVVSTPFLLKVHNYPTDCSRWTETGMKHLLAEGGFDLNNIETGSWGNQKCVIANFKEWVYYNGDGHSLKNENEFPIVVWAFAKKVR